MKLEAQTERNNTEGLPFKERYDQLNQCLYQLEGLLKNMGVSSFSVGESGRQVTWDTDSSTTDQQALGTFCKQIAHLYTNMLGKKRP